MHLYIDKKTKIYFYIFLFLLLSTISNDKILRITKIYQIENIQINNLDLDQKKIVEREIRNSKGRNIFLIKKDEINENLNSLNFIENFSIRKKFPSTLIVDVHKANFLAKIIIQNKIYYIGSNGKLIEDNSFQHKKDLPNFYGEYKKEKFFNLLFLLKKNGLDIKNIKSFYFFPSGRWDIDIEKSVKIKLPLNILEKNINILKNILKKNNDKSNYVIDLRVENQLIMSNG